jgi:hypothetical protein
LDILVGFYSCILKGENVMFFRLSFCFGFAVILICSLGNGNYAAAKGCMSGSCHQDFAGVKYMHGPIAAELAGAQGCVMCHKPAGTDCSQQHGGKFQLKKKGLCVVCHDKGTGTEHSQVQVDSKCLDCHSPHGSDLSPHLLREGK